METLVAVYGHRNQYHSRSRPEGPSGFISSPSRSFREISCKTFEAGSAILSTALKSCNSPGAKRVCCSYPQTPPAFQDSNTEISISNILKNGSLPISIVESQKEISIRDEFSFPELWAGPAYSNSPPPSSLPIPKFSLRQKRTASLNLPGCAPIIKPCPVAKSAPSSPTRKPYYSPDDLFLTPDAATKTLRRILNLDIMEE